jgi:CDP-glucose 4,6-dehydratase
MYDNIYQKRNVIVTGHTGFKGSWLALWLSQLGANTTGYSLHPPTKPNHIQLLNINMNSIIGDICDIEKLKQVFQEQKPEIVFHLAAQSIVRQSYSDPIETFTSNVLGTVNVLEAARASGTVRAIVNITSDKCYDNREWHWGYREIDKIGGYDPYSASKGCSEIITSCWRNSFFNPKDYQTKHQTLLASARAGNVIGGGDWAHDRLIPDIMRAVSQSKKVTIRNPRAIRPWQHVLEPLSGYLILGQKLLDGRKEFADAWNFGPSETENISVGEIVRQVKRFWPKVEYEIHQDVNQPHEAHLLILDCSKARTKLNWRPVWNGQTTVGNTVQWYKNYYESQSIISAEQIKKYIADAQSINVAWAEE